MCNVGKLVAALLKEHSFVSLSLKNSQTLSFQFAVHYRYNLFFIYFVHFQKRNNNYKSTVFSIELPSSSFVFLKRPSLLASLLVDDGACSGGK
mmetsp:Transcript_2372/g.2874  ORF Transcript_2372/g.2874 Transcript_2372/m.2874 type:complete len:93 (-) Transcript_2372:1127-1405(-)